MKTIAIYCAGRNELPPPGIKGIRYFPDRACVWDKLAEQYPDTQLRIYFNLPGEFIVDMWPDIFRESDLVSYIPLDEDASVEDIGQILQEKGVIDRADYFVFYAKKIFLLGFL